MKGVIAFMFFMLFLAGMAFVMLKDMASDEPPKSAKQGDATISLLSGDWRPDASTKTFVRFQSDGKINGFAGCNNFFGSFIATDETIEMGAIGSTRMACAESIMAAEHEFLTALQSAKHYHIVGEVLSLTNDSGSRLDLRLSAADSVTGEE